MDLTLDDFDIIFERAYGSLRAASRGVRGQTVTHRDCIEYWVMVETQKYLEERSAPKKIDVPGPNLKEVGEGLLKSIEKDMKKLRDAVENTKKIPSNEVPWGYPLEQKNTCPKCGLDLSPVMGYCCPNGDCPVGLGPTMC